MTVEEREAVVALRVAVEGLAVVVQDLADRVTTTEDMQAELAGQRRINGWLAASIAFDILLSLAFGFMLLRVDDNAESIDTIQDRTSNGVLCPLYELLVSQIETLPPNAADENLDGTITAEEQAKLDRTIRVVRAGYSALQCRPAP